MQRPLETARARHWIARAKRPWLPPEPASSSWRCHRVAELHGYLFDLSEPDVLDQADELSALILAIVAQLHQDGDTVLALETADWLAPFDSVPLLGATVWIHEAQLDDWLSAYEIAEWLPGGVQPDWS